ncbi:hypothetical protein V6N11_050017 [Hibiscus sabdariffa]|uniref:Zinc beta-ribbon domain-containing protein n=1 Tax=Hibiscus sabdariffa TaxID=183260 RepID=A0ABR2T9K2_9ROSI
MAMAKQPDKHWTKEKHQTLFEAMLKQSIDGKLKKALVKCPSYSDKTIFIQQDNAKPHISVDDEEFLQADLCKYDVGGVEVIYSHCKPDAAQFMQPPKETETPQKETLAQLTQPLFETSRGDGNAALEGGQQIVPADRASMDELGSWMSQLNQTVNASSSLFNQTEQTQLCPIDHTTTPPPPTDHCQIETAEVTQEAPTFWTACPYCYTLYEYPKVYEDCTLRCQANNCRKAFHAAVIPSPPVNGEETYMCSFGIFPIGFSVKGKPSPRVFYDEDDVYVEISSDDDDWRTEEGERGRICAAAAYAIIAPDRLNPERSLEE